MCPVLAIVLVVALLGDTHPGVESSTTSAVTSPSNTTATFTTSISTSNNVTSAVTTTVQTSTSSASTSVIATTQKEGRLYTVNCEASYSYDQVSLNATCKVILLNNTKIQTFYQLLVMHGQTARVPSLRWGILALSPDNEGK